MKNEFTKVGLRLLPLAFLASLLLHSCVEEEILPVEVNFSQSVQNVEEGSIGTVTINFSRPAPANALLRISVTGNAIYGEAYTTNPSFSEGVLLINVTKGQSSVNFTITTLDNMLFENGAYVVFSIFSVTQGLQLGMLLNQTFIINDDEAPSIANFKEWYPSVDENDDDGIFIEIVLSHGIQGSGGLGIQFSTDGIEDEDVAVYGKHFTTIPAAAGNRVELSASQNDTTISFKVLPIDNSLFEENKIIRVNMSSFSGAIQKGEIIEQWLIVKNDEISAISFAETTATVYEDSNDEIVVKINLTKPIPEATRLNIQGGDIKYGSEYITDPGMEYKEWFQCDIFDICHLIKYNYIPLTIPQNSTSVEFTIKPVNNGTQDGNRSYYFYLESLYSYTNTSGMYTLTILDDD